MTVEVELAKGGPYTGNGSNTSFSVPFPFTQNAELKVVHRDSDGIETTLVLDVDYSVTGAGGSSGTVTYPLSGDPLASTERLAIIRDMEFVQETDFDNQGGYYPATTEAAFDRAEMKLQQLYELIQRATLCDVTDDACAGSLAEYVYRDGTPNPGGIEAMVSSTDLVLGDDDLVGGDGSPGALFDYVQADAELTLGHVGVDVTIPSAQYLEEFNVNRTMNAGVINATRMFVSELTATQDGELTPRKWIDDHFGRINSVEWLNDPQSYQWLRDSPVGWHALFTTENKVVTGLGPFMHLNHNLSVLTSKTSMTAGNQLHLLNAAKASSALAPRHLEVLFDGTWPAGYIRAFARVETGDTYAKLYFIDSAGGETPFLVSHLNIGDSLYIHGLTVGDDWQL